MEPHVSAKSQQQEGRCGVEGLAVGAWENLVVRLTGAQGAGCGWGQQKAGGRTAS